MGTYTRVRFEAPLNPDGIVVTTSLELRRVWPLGDWGLVADSVGNAVTSYASCPRSAFIPFGAMTPGPWTVFDADRPGMRLGSRIVLDSVIGLVWKVACCVKDDGVVTAFLATLPHLIADCVDVFTWFEDDANELVHRVFPARHDAAGPIIVDPSASREQLIAAAALEFPDLG